MLIAIIQTLIKWERNYFSKRNNQIIRKDYWEPKTIKFGLKPISYELNLELLKLIGFDKALVNSGIR